MPRPTVIGAALAIALVTTLVACDEPNSRTPTQPTPPSATSIQIVGPDSVAPGESAQFLANLRLPDGTVKSATSAPNLRWRSSHTGLLQVSSTGFARAGQTRGEATLTADLLPNGAVRSTREVIIQPSGTYRIVGSIRETDAPTVPVVGARVEAMPGSISTTTDSTGQYRLYGVPPEATIKITAPGYETLEQAVQLTANVTRNFTLSPSGPRIGLNGPYLIDVEVTGNCSTSPALQTALRRRSYEAMITTTGAVVDVVLTEPRFRLNGTGRGNRFSGRVLGGGATFTLESYWSYYYSYYGPIGYPSVAELLPDSTHIVVDGFATVSGTTSGLGGTMSGGITHWDSRFPFNPRFIAGCFSSNIQFTVTQR